MNSKAAAALVFLAFAALPGVSRAADGKVLTGQAAFGGWEDSLPGVWRHIVPTDLPPPFETPSASNAPGLIARPDGAHRERRDRRRAPVRAVAALHQPPRTHRRRPVALALVSGQTAPADGDREPAAHEPRAPTGHHHVLAAWDHRRCPDFAAFVAR